MFKQVGPDSWIYQGVTFYISIYSTRCSYVACIYAGDNLIHREVFTFLEVAKKMSLRKVLAILDDESECIVNTLKDLRNQG